MKIQYLLIIHALIYKFGLFTFYTFDPQSLLHVLKRSLTFENFQLIPFSFLSMSKKGLCHRLVNEKCSVANKNNRLSTILTLAHHTFLIISVSVCYIALFHLLVDDRDLFDTNLKG